MTDPQLSVDALFDLLQNQRRRYLLYSLDQNADAVVTLDELTARVLDWERRMTDATEVPTAELKARIRTTLHHTHLPKVAELGLVEYDARSRTVRYRDAPSVVTFVNESQDEVPHLRSLFCTSATS